MNFKLEMSQLYFFYGFIECKKDQSLNYLKVKDKSYLIFKTFKYGDVIDFYSIENCEIEDVCEPDLFDATIVIRDFQPNNKIHRDKLKVLVNGEKID